MSWPKFTILQTDREEIRQALIDYGRSDIADLARLLSVNDAEYIARKTGETLMEGGEYFEALGMWAENIIENWRREFE